MSYALLGLLLGVIGAGWYGFERQRAVYEQFIESVKAERDVARNEGKVFRDLLFPVLRKAEAVQLPEGSQAKSKLADAGPKRPARSHVPFRTIFNQFRKASNTPQIKTDALAAALEWQKNQANQEKSHAS